MFEQIYRFLCHNLLYFALHFDGRSVFPKPLSAKEERDCFEKMAQGDKAARDKLISHNLRLVAHIIKKYYLIRAGRPYLDRHRGAHQGRFDV